MAMARVVAFHYDGDYHCSVCTFERYGAQLWLAAYGADMPTGDNGKAVVAIRSNEDPFDHPAGLVCGSCLGEIEWEWEPAR